MTLHSSAIEQAHAVPIQHELARRGIRLRGKGELVGPCPVCGGIDRFAVNTRKQIFNCRGCATGGDVIALVQHLDGCGFRAAVATLTGEPAPERRQPVREATPPQREDSADYERRQAAKAAWLWSQHCPIVGSPAERYLREARGYGGPFPATLGYLSPTKPEHHPAMIAAVALCDEPEPGVVGNPRGVNAVHLTLLKLDGSGKADVSKPKIFVGSPAGLPIVLAPANDLLGLAITEGIEDALSVHQATGLGAWAAGSASFLPALADAVPDYIEAVHVIVDDDPAGRRHSGELVRRLRARGIEVIPRLLRLPEVAT